MSTRPMVLITGGAGYIGSNTTAALLDAGFDAVVYDNLSSGHREAVPSAASFVQGDLGDSAALTKCLDDYSPEAVLHFAAYIEAGESMQEPERFFQNNTINALHLLEEMLKRQIKAFVFSSTAAVYGNPESTPILESSRLQPTNAYGESKLLVERVLDWYAPIHGLASASLRYFNACGGNAERGEAHSPETHLIPLILQVAKGQREQISVFGSDYPTPDGTCVRDYIHVADLASAHVLALQALRADIAARKTSQRRIYNIGNGKGFSVREVIEVARRVTGRAIQVHEAPRRDGDPAELVASSDKIRSELSWEPQHTELDSIIESAWQWYCNPAFSLEH